MKKRKFYIVFSIVFISGILVGFFIGAHLSGRRRFHPPPNPKEVNKFITRKICSKLDLTDTQKAKVTPAIEELLAIMLEQRKKSAPLLKKAFFDMFDKIEPILTPEQKIKLIELKKKTIRHITLNNSFKISEKNKKTVTSEITGATK